MNTINGQPITFGGEPDLQEKIAIPSTEQQIIIPDNGYDGLFQVTINAMPIAEQATPSITVSSAGLITANAIQDAGYVAEGTKSSTKQLTTQAATTITPSTSNQTAVTSGVYTTGAITVGAIPSSYVKPSATKAAATITPGTSNQTIAAGTYLTGAQTIKGDSNLIAANIASGKSIFGVSGSFAGAPTLLWTNASPTSNFEPQTVTLATGYSAYLVEIKSGTGSSFTSIHFLPFFTATVITEYLGDKIYDKDTLKFLGCTANWNNVRTGIRAVASAGNGSIVFLNGDADEYLTPFYQQYGIPTRIWGIKFTIS